jgi:PKD repeat protein
MTSAKILQLTNSTIGAITTGSNMPLGVATVIYPYDTSNCFPTYTVQSSTSDTLVINKVGTYSFIYNASVVASAAGEVTFVLKVNGVSKYTVSMTATEAGTINITIPCEIYIPCNCASTPNNVPAYIQVQNTGVALTSGTSNLIVSKE